MYASLAVIAIWISVGGVADMAWHQLFGIEVGVDALLNPSHLVLLTGGALIVATGWRAQRAASPDRARFPELLSPASAQPSGGRYEAGAR